MNTQIFKPGQIAPHPDNSTNKLYYVYCDGLLLSLVEKHVQWRPLTHDELSGLPIDVVAEHYLGELGENMCVALEVSCVIEHTVYRFKHLRSLLFSLDITQFTVIARGKQLIDWHNHSRYCGACGKPTLPHESDRARHCQACDLTFYPKIAPCIIVLVTRGNTMLLARSPHFPEGMYSTLAGFVEAGESVEDCLHREVLEEVGVKVKNLHYITSQPWPFPHQLMLGFHAEYDSGDIVVDGEEIVAADWFHYENLPSIPPPFSISGQLIQRYVNTVKANSKIDSPLK